MAKKSAPERELNELHALQTKVYTMALQSIIEALSSEDEEMKAIAMSAVNPSLLNAINSFLKNNDITCQPEVLTELTNTERRLKDKLKTRSEMPTFDLDEMQEMARQ